MSAAERSRRAREVVQSWVESTLEWGPDKVGVHPVPHLSTPRYELVQLAQAGFTSGGDLYVMTDGERVLPAGVENLGMILAEEGFAADPAALEPELVAGLLFLMAEPGRGRPIVEEGDRALARLPAEVRSAFRAPHAERDGDGVRLELWSERSFGGDVERWRVRLAPDGALEDDAELVAAAT
jgi:catechol 2,3-dioxygenase-like lactoylglutathione lyase family enzyme